MHTEKIDIRVSPEFRDLLKRKASNLNLSVSAFVRLAVTQYEVKKGVME